MSMQAVWNWPGSHATHRISNTNRIRFETRNSYEIHSMPYANNETLHNTGKFSDKNNVSWETLWYRKYILLLFSAYKAILWKINTDFITLMICEWLFSTFLCSRAVSDVAWCVWTLVTYETLRNNRLRLSAKTNMIG